MSFASRLIPRSSHAARANLAAHASSAARGYFLVALGVLVLGLGGGCDDKHIGRPCNTNVPDAGATGGGISILTSPSLECPSRICLQAAPEGVTSADEQAKEGAMCTASCSTDDDCSDGDPGTLCKKGFICTWPTTSGDFCCQKMCVCHDFVVVPPKGIPEPSACLSPSAGGPSPPTCKNVSP
jgi:hypothetical protein